MDAERDVGQAIADGIERPRRRRDRFGQELHCRCSVCLLRSWHHSLCDRVSGCCGGTQLDAVSVTCAAAGPAAAAKPSRARSEVIDFDTRTFFMPSSLG